MKLEVQESTANAKVTWQEEGAEGVVEQPLLHLGLAYWPVSQYGGQSRWISTLALPGREKVAVYTFSTPQVAFMTGLDIRHIASWEIARMAEVEEDRLKLSCPVCPSCSICATLDLDPEGGQEDAD